MIHAGPPYHCDNDYTTEAHSNNLNHLKHWTQDTINTDFCFVYHERHDADNNTQLLQGWQMFGGSYLQAVAPLICFALEFGLIEEDLDCILAYKKKKQPKILLADWQVSVRIKSSREEK